MNLSTSKMSPREYYYRIGRALVLPIETQETLGWMAAHAAHIAGLLTATQDKKGFMALLYEAEVQRISNDIIKLSAAVRAFAMAPYENAHQTDEDGSVPTEPSQSDDPRVRESRGGENHCNGLGAPPDNDSPRGSDW